MNTGICNSMVLFTLKSLFMRYFSLKEGLVNVANQAYPKFLCPPCASSRRGCLSQGKGDMKVKATWAFMEKEYPHKCKEAIRSGRVKPMGENPEIPGVNCIGEGTLARRGVIAKFEEKVTSQSQVRIDAGTMRLPKKAYIAQSLLHWGEGPDEATASWRAKMLKAGIAPDSVGAENVPVPFYKPVEHIGSVGRSTEHAMTRPKAELCNETDMKRALEKMSGQHAANELMDNYCDLGGDSFKCMLDNVPSSSTPGRELTSEQLKLHIVEPSDPRKVVQGDGDEPVDTVDGEDDGGAVTVPRSSV